MYISGRWRWTWILLNENDNICIHILKLVEFIVSGFTVIAMGGSVLLKSPEADFIVVILPFVSNFGRAKDVFEHSELYC